VPSRPPSQSWRSFLRNHAKEIVAIDFLTVPTATFRILYVFTVLAHDRRKVVHFSVTDSPTANWTGQELVNAFPYMTAPRFLLRDRDGIFGEEFRRRVASLGMEEKLIAPWSPWQNPYVKRLIGTLRREFLDHVIVIDEQHLRRVIQEYLEYYHQDRTHRSLDQDCPVSRSVETIEQGKIYEFPNVGGLHHRYQRQAA
jgi:putative transposase